jgi:hypothetical protein
MFQHELFNVFFATFHDRPPSELDRRMSFLSRARERKRLTAIVPRDVPSSLAICLSL